MNQTEIINAFNQHLDIRGVSQSTKKNYTADIRNFLSWLKESMPDTKKTLTDMLTLVSTNTVQSYIKMLAKKGNKESNIQRKLSSLRTFFSFAQSQQWTKLNPAKATKNITYPHTARSTNVSNKPVFLNNLLDQFRNTLMNEDMSKSTVKNYLSDTRQFIEWLKRENKNAN